MQHPVGAKKPIRRRQVDRREAAESALLEAAISVIAAKGVQKTTLGEVGEAAGFSRGITAHYFRTKIGLLQAAAEYMAEQYGSLLSSGTKATGMKVLEQFVELQCSPERLDVARALYLMQKEAFFESSGLQEILRKHNRRAVKRLEREIDAGIKLGEIRKDADAKSEATILLAMGRGIRALWLHAPDSMDLKRFRTDMLDFLRTNLAAKR